VLEEPLQVDLQELLVVLLGFLKGQRQVLK
jgi:hypothetical protein